MNNPSGEKNSLLNVLSIRDFRLLFAGSTTSLLGDQFALIATPWLVLQLTSDPLALGMSPLSCSPGSKPALPKQCWVEL